MEVPAIREAQEALAVLGMDVVSRFVLRPFRSSVSGSMISSVSRPISRYQIPSNISRMLRRILSKW